MIRVLVAEDSLTVAELLIAVLDGDPEVAHLDLYRLESVDEVWELGWTELGEGRQIVLIEWAERAESLLPGDRWDIYLGVEGESTRSLRAVCVGRAPALPEPG